MGRSIGTRIQPERDSFGATQGTTSGLSRRDLLKALGGGLLVLACGPIARPQGRGDRQGGQTPQNLSAWIHIAPDGRITAFTGKVEVGQNARTSLTQAVAEELRAPLASVVMVMGDTDLCPFDQGTFGSRTTPAMMPVIRRAAASAREALIDNAAKKWGVDRSALRAEVGKVHWSSASSEVFLTYGELAKDIPADSAIREVTLTPTESWKALGQSVPKVEGRAIVTGRHEYTSDLKRPGMLYAKVLRPLSLGAELVSVKSDVARSLPGVQVVQDGAFVAVAAPTLREAEKALFSLVAEWTEKPGPSNKELFGILRGPLGSTAEGSRSGLSTTYSCQYIAHAPLEPRAALVEWDGSKMTVHTGTQRPFGVRTEVARALGLDESKVRVIVPDTGSGYGGKHSGDAAVEAARIAMAIGKPVKLVWTREEEFTFAYFRPAGVIELAAEVGDGGRIAKWEHVNFNSGGASIGCPYDVADPVTQYRQAQSPLRQGSYRALAATFNNFARESFIDELAHSARLDPLEFRLKNLKNERLRAVLEEAAKRFGWGKARSVEGSAFGLACGIDKGGYVATCAEVSVNRAAKDIKVHRVVTVFECGAVVNPEQLKNQVEGAVLQGLGGALFEKIEFEGGRILNPRFSAYRVPRFTDVPKMDTILLNRTDLPSAGGGECPIIAIAPAIGNAVFQAIGVRLRSLPLLSAEGW